MKGTPEGPGTRIGRRSFPPVVGRPGTASGPERDRRQTRQAAGIAGVGGRGAAVARGRLGRHAASPAIVVN